MHTHLLSSTFSPGRLLILVCLLFSTTMPLNFVLADDRQPIYRPGHKPDQQADQRLNQRLNINTAGPALLAERLPGIGPAKAKAIVEYREQHGPFKALDNLKNVKGIGPSTLQKIRLLIFIDLKGTQKTSSADTTNKNAANAGRENDRAMAQKTQQQQELSARNAVRAALIIARKYLQNEAN